MTWQPREILRTIPTLVPSSTGDSNSAEITLVKIVLIGKTCRTADCDTSNRNCMPYERALPHGRTNSGERTADLWS